MKKTTLFIVAAAAVMASCQKYDDTELKQTIKDLQETIDDLRGEEFSICLDKKVLCIGDTFEGQILRKVQIPYSIIGSPTQDIKLSWFNTTTWSNQDTYVMVSIVPENNVRGVIEIQQHSINTFEDCYYRYYNPINISIVANRMDGRTAIQTISLIEENWIFEAYGERLSDEITAMDVNPVGETIAIPLTHCYYGYNLKLKDSTPVNKYFSIDNKSNANWVTGLIEENDAPFEVDDDYNYKDYNVKLTFSRNTTGAKRECEILLCKNTSVNSTSYVYWVHLKFIQKADN